MRDIKFRGWHIEDKVMYKSDEDHKVYLTFTANDGGQIFWEIYFDSSKRISYVDDRNGILMQYTGLKDKKKDLTDIYEGDIIDENGLVIGNVWEDKDVYQEGTHLIVEGMGTKAWRDTEQKAMERGCTYAE